MAAVQSGGVTLSSSLHAALRIMVALMASSTLILIVSGFAQLIPYF